MCFIHRFVLGVAVLLAAHAVALADTDPASLTGTLSAGTGIIFFPRERIYHATTRCRELDYHDCGVARRGEPLNTVIVNHEARTSAQLLLDYHPFGRPDRGDSWLAPQRFSTALVSSYGVHAEDRRLVEGLGLSYTLAAVDAFRRHDALTIELGAVWLPDVHVMRPDQHVGRVSDDVAPTEQQAMTAAMATVSLAF